VTDSWQRALVDGGREVGWDKLTDITVDALTEELEVLRNDPELAASARASTAANLDVVREVIAGRLTLAEVEPPPQAVAFARDLARRNVPVGELDRAYRIAALALWRWGVTEVRARVDGDVASAIQGISEAAFSTANVFAATVMARYAQERERWLRSSDAIRAATVQEILGGGAVDVVRASARLRYELRQNHQAFITWALDDIAESTAQGVGGRRALLTPLSSGAVAGWAPAGSLDPAALPPSASLAVGSPGAGLDGFRRSHAEAQQARRVAQQADREPGVVHYDDVALVALLTHDLEQARRFARRTLGPLAEPDPAMRRLAETLRVVLENQGSPRRAAHVLGVHENTVAKRLRAVEELLGDEVRDQPAELLGALAILDIGVD
jgi:PucR-like helix-turn-helix protein/diguanylate cyclase with GGDEF domain